MYNGRKEYAHKATNEKVVGEGTKPPARVPAGLNVRPLQGPRMEPIKGVPEEELEAREREEG